MYIEIQVDNIQRAVKFYQTIFGWTFTKQEGLPIEYWRFEIGKGDRGGILGRPVPIPAGPAGTNAYVCSFEVADFDATSALILANGGIVAMPKFAVPGVCWQGYFQDGEHNTFGIFQPDPNAK